MAPPETLPRSTFPAGMTCALSEISTLGDVPSRRGLRQLTDERMAVTSSSPRSRFFSSSAGLADNRYEVQLYGDVQ